MTDMMPEGQRVFIESLCEYVKSATNMTGDEAYSFAFRVWQMQEHLRGYLSAGADWISVKDRLPGARNTILIYSGTIIGEGHITIGGNWEWSDGISVRKPVTHWMPIPEPPEVEE